MSPTPAQNRRGILAMMAAMAVFTANDTAMKLALTSLPVGQSLAIRGLFALAVSVALVVLAPHGARLDTLIRPSVVIRAILEALAAIAFFIGVKTLALADVVAINQASTLMIAAYCAVTGLAPMGWRRWMAVCVGFVGVLVIVQPGATTFHPTVLVAVLAAVLVSARDITTRKIPPGIPSIMVLCSTSVAVFLGGASLALVETWVMPSGKVLLLLVLASIFVTLGHYFVITAFRGVDVAIVSPFRYTVLIWAIMAGTLVFGEIPTVMTLIGMALIAGSGLYTVHRERLRERAAAGRLAPHDTGEVVVSPR